MTRTTGHVAALDGVRGLAILGVLIFHLYTPSGSWTTRVTTYGGSGVELFFVLSGFLITGILLDSKKATEGYFKNFYARRTLRILPLYYGTLLLLLVVVPAIHPIRDEKFRFTIDHQAWLWLYVNNLFEAYARRPMPLFGHFWSLAIEEQFYLVWPLVVFHSSARTLRWICLACVMVAIGARMFFLTATTIPTDIFPRITLCQIDALAIGAALAATVRMQIGSKEITKVAALGVGAMATLIAAQLASPRFAAGTVSLVATGAIFPVAFGAIVWGAIGGFGPRPVRLLELAPLRTLGKYSYGIYVLHWMIGRGCSSIFPALAHTESVAIAAAFAVGQMVVSFVVAFASWHLYEKHFIALKKYFVVASAPSS